MSQPVLELYRRITRWPCGHWLFAKAVCWRAPYFASIAPRVTRLEPGRCEGMLRHRRGVTNHLGSVHAIALCNLAELTAGLATEVTIPAAMRWIPRGMQVEYLKKAVGTMHAVATPAAAAAAGGPGEGYELPVDVAISDPGGAVVFRARIAMWVSPRPR